MIQEIQAICAGDHPIPECHPTASEEDPTECLTGTKIRRSINGRSHEEIAHTNHGHQGVRKSLVCARRERVEFEKRESVLGPDDVCDTEPKANGTKGTRDNANAAGLRDAGGGGHS